MNQKKRPEPEPDVVSSDSSMMQLRRFEKRGTNLHSSQRARGPVRETLRENGQQRTREREKENKPKKKQRKDLAHRKPGGDGRRGRCCAAHVLR